jgi:hypothetical protein
MRISGGTGEVGVVAPSATMAVVLSGTELIIVVLAVGALAVMAASAIAGVLTRLRRGKVPGRHPRRKGSKALRYVRREPLQSGDEVP